MIFGSVDLNAAHGAILAHSHQVPGGRLRKGLVLDETHIERLRQAGLSTVVVARLESGDVHEDEAATRIGALVGVPTLQRGTARNGRANLFADAAGLLVVDVAAVDAVNVLDEGIMVSTLPQSAFVQAGELVATVKVIPYAVPGKALARVEAVAHRAIRVAPLASRRAGLVLSAMPGTSNAVLEMSENAQRDRLEALGSSLVRVDRVRHESAPVAAALRAQVDAGLDPVLFLGASAIKDHEDVLPSALHSIGGRVDQLGIPVDPGNLLLLGRCDGALVIGVPGCARSPRPSGFDGVLRRVLAGQTAETMNLHCLGVGGLLKEFPLRPSPRDVQMTPPVVAAVVLATGDPESLLVDLDGEPLVRRNLLTLMAGAVHPVIVVTAHDDVSAAVTGLGAVLTHFESVDTGTPMRTGLDAVPEAAHGVLVASGDMPPIRPQDLEALIEAFDPHAHTPSCMPTVQRKRGHPVVWPRAWFTALRACPADVDTSEAIDAHTGEVRLVSSEPSDRDPDVT